VKDEAVLLGDEPDLPYYVLELVPREGRAEGEALHPRPHHLREGVDHPELVGPLIEDAAVETGSFGLRVI